MVYLRDEEIIVVQKPSPEDELSCVLEKRHQGQLRIKGDPIPKNNRRPFLNPRTSHVTVTIFPFTTGALSKLSMNWLNTSRTGHASAR
jgi:hypothetical protein